MKDKWFRLIGIPVLGIAFPLINFSFSDPNLITSMLVTTITVATIWHLNRVMIVFLRRWLSWERYAFWHVTLQSIGSVILSSTFIFLAFQFEYKVVFNLPMNMLMVQENIFLGGIVALMVNGIYDGMYFWEKWKINFMTAEVLRQEHLRSQFESLKNQVNPHFLFNSLNTLTVLIEEDETLATRFVQELANVYRYVLDNSARQLVPVPEEIEFAKAYTFLLKMRFGQNLEVTIDIPAECERKSVPPLSLQILIENAVKHNVISKGKPLHITIDCQDNHLAVRNNLQRKKVHEESTHIGLKNIHERYSYLSGQQVKINETPEVFEVLLPLLTQKSVAAA